MSTPDPTASRSAAPVSRLLACAGPRQAEERALEWIAARLAEAEREPRLLARPLRVIVPSTSLRDHLAAEVVRRRGRAAAGLVVETLYAAAVGVLAAAGEIPRRGGAAFEVLARRFAASMPAIAAALAGLDEGLGTVSGSLRDLLDAGFTAAHLPAVEERLADLARLRPPAELARARELVRVAAALGEAMPALGLARTADAYTRAHERLRQDPGRLPARAVLIHGFANATGLALDFLATLAETLAATTIVDLPPDPSSFMGPASPSGESQAAGVAGAGFAERLVLRLSGRTVASFAVPAPPPARLELIAAPGAWAEARAVALAARRALDAGVRPEAIGLVARDLAAYRLPLRHALSRLGVPFSALSASGSAGEGERRARAAIELAALGDKAGIDLWLALGRGAGAALELRLGLGSLGLARLADLATLDPESVLVSGRLPLPLREARGEEGEGEGEDDDAPAAPARLARRALSGPALRAAVEAARRLLGDFARWPARTTAAGHLRRLEALFFRRLEIPRESLAGERLVTLLAALGGELPAELELGRDELASLLRRQARELSGGALGGAGGGVQVLTATEARGRTFERLFLLGLNRDVFPRRVEEDALLPDPVREALRLLLPDLPVKGEGHEEERYLFAQLLAAAPAVTLSWQATTDDGAPASPSPLLVRLKLGRRDLPLCRAPHATELPAVEDAPLPAVDWAVLAARHGGREALFAVEPVALAANGEAEPAALARARAAALAELDPDLGSPEGRRAGQRLGPYLGLVGGGLIAGACVADPAERLYVTHLEGLARCAWQSFVGRTLGLEPSPDPGGPFPSLDGPLVGQVVHQVLAGLVERAGGLVEVPLADVLGREPVAVAWPGTGSLGALALAAAREVARDEGVPLLAPTLAERARVLLTLAARLGLGEGWRALGAEIEGSCEVLDAAGRPRTIAFRADLVDLAPSATAGGERLRLTDIKTGKPWPEVKTAAKRQEKLRAAIQKGERLQVAAYVQGTAGALGRYLFLGQPAKLVDQPELREMALAAGDGAEPLADAARALLAARDAGAWTPRLLAENLEDLGPACRYCRVREACVQGDSGAVRRFARWVEAERREPRGETGSLAALALAVFDLGRQSDEGDAPAEGG